MKEEVKVSFWGVHTKSTEQSSITSYPTGYKPYANTYKLVYDIERDHLFRKLNELKSNNTDIDIDTFKEVRFLYLLLRMHEFKGKIDDEKMLEEILYKNRNKNIEFEEVAKEFKLSNLKYSHAYSEFVKENDRISEANQKYFEDKAKGKYLGHPYEPIGYEFFTKVFKIYLIEPIKSLFETEKTIQERELAKIRFFSYREKAIEDEAIKKAEKSGGVVLRPIHNIKEISAKEPDISSKSINASLDTPMSKDNEYKDYKRDDIESQMKNGNTNKIEEFSPKESDVSSKSTNSFLDRFRAFFTSSITGKKVDSDMNKQYDDDIESQRGNITSELKDIQFDFINEIKKDVDRQATATVASNKLKPTKPSIKMSKDILDKDLEMGLGNTDNDMGVKNQR